jgi:hypothetical protein
MSFSEALRRTDPLYKESLISKITALELGPIKNETGEGFNPSQLKKQITSRNM